MISFDFIPYIAVEILENTFHSPQPMSIPFLWILMVLALFSVAIDSLSSVLVPPSAYSPALAAFQFVVVTLLSLWA